MLFVPRKFKISGEDSQISFGFWSWLLMLFQTGMGTGLLFWGGVEPLWHAQHPPPLATDFTLTDALALTWFHWGILPWVLYTLVALWLASFLKTHPQRSNTTDTPIHLHPHASPASLGGQCVALITAHPWFTTLLASKRIPSWGVKLVYSLKPLMNTAVVWGVLMGTVATLCMGVLQWHGSTIAPFIHASTSGGSVSQLTLYGVLFGFCGCFLASALSGVATGVKWLSWLTSACMVVLLGMVLAWEPVYSQLSQGFTLFVQALGAWFMKTPYWMWGLPTHETTHTLPQFVTATGAYQARSVWVSEWTGKYWSWWLAWTPFVSQFMLSISKGRSVRSVAFFGVIVPTLFSVGWFSVFTLFAMNSHLPLHTLSQAPQWTYQALGLLPWGEAARFLLVVLIALGVINSLDAVVITLSELMGWHPSKKLTLLWTGLIAGIACWAFASGGLPRLQTLTLHHTLPYTLCLMGLMTGWFIQKMFRYLLDKSVSTATNAYSHKTLKPELYEL